ncbi:MAG TPA: hypothetical protein VNU48_12235, partial [Burkholderiaceae bacterium]|nr:hypothetical protein [Burkholderiaceae bacterium]
MSRRAAALDTQQLSLFEESAPPVAPLAPMQTIEPAAPGVDRAPAAPPAEAVASAGGLAPAVFRHP